MNKHLTLFLLTIFTVGLTVPTSHAAARKAAPATSNLVEGKAETDVKPWNELSKKEKRQWRKNIKKELKEAIKDFRRTGSADTETLVLVIIAILLPPLAMALYDGISNRFWISLLLTILLYIPGLIYTLYIILKGK